MTSTACVISIDGRFVFRIFSDRNGQVSSPALSCLQKILHRFIYLGVLETVKTDRNGAAVTPKQHNRLIYTKTAPLK